MQALILALLLCLLLDQNDRSQRLVSALGAKRGLAGRGALALLIMSIALAAILVATGGALLSRSMEGAPRLLFFALGLIFGGAGMLMPVRLRPLIQWSALDSVLDRAPVLVLRLFVARLTDRASFATLGVAVLTGDALLTAMGAMAGALAALLPPLGLGARYAKLMPLSLIGWIGGCALVITGVTTGLSALSLL